MFKKLLVIMMVLAFAAAAYAAECPMHRQGKSFKGYTSAAAGQPCPSPCPGMKKADTPCPMMKDGSKSAPCPNMKQGTAPCGKECMKKCEKCPQVKDCKYRKDCMNRKKSGKAPCFKTMSGANKPCPYAKDATK